jgi:hypothetical protein
VSPTPATPPQRRTASRFRRWFRACRIAVLLVLIAVLGALLYLNRIGLPGWLKAELLTELERRGADVRFTRLRWRWHRGFVADHVFLRRAARPRDPFVQIDELAFDLDWARLLHTRQLELVSCRIVDGHLAIPMEPPGTPPEFFALDQVSAVVRAPDPNQWELVDFRANFLGARIRASGVLTNALRLRPKAAPPGADAAGAEFWRSRLRHFVHTCQRMQFAEPPEFRLRFQGDARDLTACTVGFRALSADARSPWVDLRNLRLSADLNSPAPTNGTFNITLRLEVEEAQTPWGRFARADLAARSVHRPTQIRPVALAWDLAAEEARTPLGRFDRAQLGGRSEPDPAQPGRWLSRLDITATGLDGQWGGSRSNRFVARLVHSLTNPVPDHATLTAQLDQVQSRWGTAGEVQADIEFQPQPSPRAAAREPLASLAPFAIAGSLGATDLRAQGVVVERLDLAGRWSAPALLLSNVQARLAPGTLALPHARLDLASREVTLDVDAALDAHALAPRLGPGVEAFLGQFDWEPTRPPRVRANARVVLPSWTNAVPDWPAAVLPTLVLNAAIQGENAAYRGVPIQQAALSVSMSNRVLRLHDFHVVRPEGEGDLAYTLDIPTRNFRWDLRCRLDPVAVAPAIDVHAPAVAALFRFAEPASATGTVWGCWGPRREINLDLDVAATNFTFRGQPVGSFAAAIVLTNRFLSATRVELHDPAQSIAATRVGFDLEDQIVRIEGASGRIDPARIARAIGTNIVRLLEPYRFDSPIQARVEGQIPTRGALDAADLRVEFQGGAFHYWRFNLDRIAGRLHWRANTVTLTNLSGTLREGDVAGDIRLRLRPDGSADFDFRAALAGVNAGLLLADTVTTTNRIAGRLGGTLEIVQANSADWKSWNGVGTFDLRDGMLWDLPIFSVLSTVLNAVAPGLGNNKAKAAHGTFLILDSVMQSDDIEIVADPARLSYRGTLDFDWNVRARVEAEILPGAPLIGPLLNILFLPVTKALIFRVTGTLGHPELEPLYIPKFLLPVLRPWHTLKSVVPGTRKPEH